MSRQFIKIIPKIPLYKKNMYDIPENYSRLYEKQGITNLDEQKTLFYVSQFGGFKFKKIPSYLKYRDKFFKTWFQTKDDLGFLQFKANSNFISRLGDMQVEPLIRRKFRTEKYKDRVLFDNGFSRKDADEIESLQSRLNNYYGSLRLNIRIPTSGITCEDRIELSRFNSIPYLQYKPKAGGRLFQSGPGSSYQRISSNLRPFLTINGESITEIDITAAALQFLNITSTKYLGLSFITKERWSQDPYQYFLNKINSKNFKDHHNESSNLCRDNLKNIMYTLIYSTLNSQERNINRRLKVMGKNYFYSDLKKEFHEFFELLSNIKSMPSIDGKIYPAHIAITYEESKFAREVLKRGCLQENFVVLPIHDSFITTKSNGKKLENIIHNVSKEFYGYVMPFKYKI